MRLVSQRAAGQTAGTAAVRTQRPGKDPRTRRGRRPSWLDRPITGCGRRRGSPFTARIVTPTAPERCVRAGPTASWALLTGLCLRGRDSRAPRGRDPAPRPPTPARKPRIPYPSPPTPCKLRPCFPDRGVWRLSGAPSVRSSRGDRTPQKAATLPSMRPFPR